MKPVTQLTGTLAIAILCGSGGYLLGKKQPAENTTDAVERATTNRQSSNKSPARANSSPSIDLKDIHAKLDAEKNPLLRFKLAMQNMEAWVQRHPVDALDWLKSQPKTERRDELIRVALNHFSENDPKGAAGWATANLAGADLNNTLIAIAENWAEQNGLEATTWFLALPQSNQRDAAVENLIFSWASNEPEAALRYLKENPSLGDLSPVLQRATLAGWAKSDPVKAVTTSLALSQTNNDPGLFGNTLANWATMDLQASSDWLIEQVKTGGERAAAIQELATIYAQQSPDAGIVWLGKLNTGSERDAAASSLAAAWSRADADAAAKWASSQNSSVLSPDAVNTLVHNFIMNDATAFQAWRATLPEGPLKQQADKIGTPAAEE
ncbi:MAG: hypothetical protein ABIT37_21195 [Luteolibacter sp.]